jgi:hypothetical protein
VKLEIPPEELELVSRPVTSVWPSLAHEQLAMLGRSWSSYPTYADAQERKRVYRICTTVFPELDAFLSQAIPETSPSSQPVHTGAVRAARSAIVASIFRAYPDASSGYPGPSRGLLEAPWCRLVGTEPEATPAWAVRPPNAPRAGA